ncbi:eukaryotic translation elongation factor 1 delta b (guanine nucleotide exchange protein) isoform X2 [Poecilia reticulata]|uniref:eukaryotic translation elongation factor 1 delta b (guanine nucleotide exchange protein) isoform X2 n=2 Tax=Poecilia reticulata TaxID=8081 RepID=UPI0004A4DA88|nr:PREDICTED: elongation factor 1-delta isoform X2 [Poecilia reticulata]
MASIQPEHVEISMIHKPTSPFLQFHTNAAALCFFLLFFLPVVTHSAGGTRVLPTGLRLHRKKDKTTAMSKKISQCSVKDQSEHDQPPSQSQLDQTNLGCRKKMEPGQRNGETTSSSPESGSLNGNGKRSGKSRRRKKRSSNPGSHHEGKTDEVKNKEKPDEHTSQSPEQPAALMGLQSECGSVWFERNIYEQAESLYQCWLVSSANRISKPNRSHQSSGKRSSNPSTVVPSSSGPACHPVDQVACHHIVQKVWVNKTTFDQAERRFVEGSAPPSAPNSLDLSPPTNCSGASRTPDEGYQSQAPTPATPVVQQAAGTPAPRQSINGLPRIPVELLREVWLDKPAYDRAEAAFYQNLYANNSSKRQICTPTTRGSDHPQSLMEEEEEEEEDSEDMAEEEKPLILQCKAEVFHALHPIQEEEEPAESLETEEPSGVCFFLHPDSEPVWLDKWRYDAAENRFQSCGLDKVCAAKKNRRPEAEKSSASSKTPKRDKKMSSVDFLAQEKIWFEKPRYDEAERRFYERTNGSSQNIQDIGANAILQDIARARENIQKSLAGNSGSSNSGAGDQGEIISRIKSLELENQSLYKVVDNLRAALSKLECRVAVLEKRPASVTPAPAASVPFTNGTAVQQKASAPVKQEEEDDDDEDDIDLFGSDEDEEAEKLKEQRLKEYAEKKAKKPAIIAKSSILLDVKPWDDETDMAKLEECVRSVQADGLLWGTSKLVPVGYGIKKLQIACVVEDDKVGTDLLEEEITKFEDYVQSVDVAAFNKI